MSLPHGDQMPEPTSLYEDSDEHIDLSDVGWDDSLVLIVFWVLAGVVFLQFFTRYILNDSYTWTEEIARYLLIWVTFFGLFMVVRKQSNVAVEIFYRWLPLTLRRVLSTVVDVIAVMFYAAATYLCILLALRTQQSMTSIDVPKAGIYWGVTFGLAVATLYAAFIAWRHWRTGSSPLVRMADSARAPQRPGMD
ncbi:MAG: TRAP transporter small permease [Hyphomicrobiales bacterium]